MDGLERTVNQILDYVRAADTTNKPEGWPVFPLRDMEALLEWELFLEDAENFQFSVSFTKITFSEDHFDLIRGHAQIT